MWNSQTHPTEQSNLLSSTPRINLSDSTIKPKSNTPIYKALAAIIGISLCLIAITSLFRHSYTTTSTQLLTNNHQTTSNIRGGQDASGLDYPWMASWRFDDIHCCTGSLINKNPPIVATAAHCVTCEQTTMDLRRTLTDPPDDNAEEHNILYWIQHPNYESPTVSSNDIALVILDGITNIDPIPMVPPKIATSDVYPVGTAMQIFGYGFIDEADSIISDQLQEGIINAWTKTDCFTYLDEFCNYSDRWDNNVMLCGYDPNTSTERGDSGGPALMNGYLSGINSWSPPSENCEAITGPNYQILDVFVDVGSVRHWIEDIKPTSETYFIAIHICDDSSSTVTITGGLFAILHGSNGNNAENIELSNPQLTSMFVAGDFNVFVINDIDNIGWVIDTITLQSQSNDDAICIDMVVAGRLDGGELVTGATEKFWMQQECNGDVTPCYNEYELQLKKRCGNPSIDGIEEIVDSSIEENLYTLIIHVCDEEVTTVGGSLDNIYVRMHGVLGITEWFELKNNAMNTSLVQDGIFIFNVDVGSDIGINIDSVEFQIDSNDALCVDMVTAGNAKYPFYWKGSHEPFFIDNPCDVNPINGIQCNTLKTVQLTCYDF